MVLRTNWPACLVCGKAVSTESGCLAISTVVARPGIERRRRVAWGHLECYPDNFLKIPYTEIDTIQKVVGRRIMVMDEEWFDEADWDMVVAAHYDRPLVKS